TCDHLLSDALRRVGRDTEQREVDLVLGDELPHGVERLDLKPLVDLPDLARIAVEDRHDVEPARGEAPILQQGTAQVTESDQGQRPITINPQNSPQRRDQVIDPIADPRMAKLAEECEVLANLRVLDRQRLSKLAA